MGSVSSVLTYEHLIYHPPRPAGYSQEQAVAKTVRNEKICLSVFEPFTFEHNAADGEKPLLLFSHGNADDLGTCKAYCQWLADSVGARVLAYDYVGYGRSEDQRPSEDSMCRAIEAAYSYATGRLAARDVVLVGKSLGSVPTVYLAARKNVRVRGVVLISALASGARVYVSPEYVPKSVMPRLDAIFGNSFERIKKVTSKVLFVHGTRDQTVPFRNSEQLCCVLPVQCYYPPLWVDADHNDIETLHANNFIDTLNSFVQNVCHEEPQAGVV